MKNKLINKTGITLIALVITIIVLLILAGVSISMISSQDGIIKKTTAATKQTQFSELKEKFDLVKINDLDDDSNNFERLKVAIKGSNVEKEFKIDNDNEKVSYGGDNEYIDAWLKEISIEIGEEQWNKGLANVEVKNIFNYNDLEVYYKINDNEYEKVLNNEVNQIKVNDVVEIALENEGAKKNIKKWKVVDNIKPIFVEENKITSNNVNMVKASNIQLASLLTSTVTININVMDEQSGISEITTTVYDKSGNNIMSNNPSFDKDNAYEVKCSSSLKLVKGDEYIIKVVAKDNAGNIAEKSCNVKVTGDVLMNI